MNISSLKYAAYVAFGLVLVTSYVHADTESSFAGYREVRSIRVPTISVSTVVEVPLQSINTSFGLGVVDTSQKLIPYIIEQTAIQKTFIPTISGTPSQGVALSDHDPLSYIDFDLPVGVQDEFVRGTAALTFSYAKPITSSELQVTLAPHVANPTSVEIHAMVNGVEKVLVSKTFRNVWSVTFPETTSDTWIVTFSYSQPLRIVEAQFIGSDTRSSFSSLRFLATPGETYTLYHGADRTIPRFTDELPILSGGSTVKGALGPSSVNSAYVLPDSDKDTVTDALDNCVMVPNKDQVDVDMNGRGDACDDFDRDGVINSRDNCVNVTNVNQVDTDGDGMGDKCDSEESRITEKYIWLPWLGVGGVFCVLIGLMFLALKSFKKDGLPIVPIE